MFKKLIFFIVTLVLFTNQGNSQSLTSLKEINKVWAKFYQAFDSLNHQLMAEIHSKKLIRISGGKKISDYETYIGNYKKNFKRARENAISNTISLRFFERIHTDSIASERGIYKLIRTREQEKEQVYYGQFHVILIKENNMWKILMDYDSDEANSIREEEYMKSYGINEFNAFIQK
ncbi:MAG: DUF4440 domain-containing protein [Flavobacteriaceae bacterium]|nr:MAG: DUF4440 domain-containing protein [Flavobacteriaceae bacterium]